MHTEVDQSGRIEESKGTVLAFSDEISYAILIPAKVKRDCLGILRSQRVKRIHLQIFCAGIFLLIERHLGKIESITIDEEYTGKERDIKRLLLQHIRNAGVDFPKGSILFMNIRRKSEAHKKAIGVYRGKNQPDRVIEKPRYITRLILKKK